ncbi:MAG: hypothetical protein ACREBO_01385 [Novosphingobium sp.]
MLTTLLALTLASAATGAAEPELTSGPTKMTTSEIRAYNSTLARDDPHYIRCARVEETGSLVRKRSTCRTNEEWRRIEEGGNREARDAVEGLQKGWSSGKG